MDSAFTIAEAFAVKDGKIVAAGKNDDILNRYRADSMIDAKSMAVYPGFIDAHAHFVGYGRSLFEVNLYDCKDWEEKNHISGTKAYVFMESEERKKGCIFYLV